jgi:para-aminobenzoate synthetase component I
MKERWRKRKMMTSNCHPQTIVKRKFSSYSVTDTKSLKLKMLNWSKQFSIFCLLDDNHNAEDQTFDCLIGAGNIKTLKASAGTAFFELENFIKEEQDWAFGHIGYDLKNEVEQLTSGNRDSAGFPDIFFFIPEVVFILKDKELKIGVIDKNADKVFEAIVNMPVALEQKRESGITLDSRYTKEEYLETIGKIREHILVGDCYEINLCQEFYAEEVSIDPAGVYNKLTELSPNPFSGFYKLNDKYLLCASPERFLKKTGKKLISQPIKGTCKRDLKDKEQDDVSKHELLNSAKERSENVMITDLVRNDLSKISTEGSVNVDELFGIYSFPQVHQMISTVSATLATESIADILKATFPMGSMTGAPKKRVMELIEHYERTKRGVFSGSIGYITPEGDFDLNVVIRSIIYNSSNKYLSISAGSAITFHSKAEDEYEECLLKISAMKKALV